MKNDALNNAVLGQIGSLIDEINGDTVKKAAAMKKKADEEAGGSGSAKADPGGYKGKSTHPSAKADGGLHPAAVGFRSKENDEDVKKDVPANVEQADKSTGDSDYDQIQVGTKKAPTGEDPSVEDAYDGKKSDPGTSHPANAEDVGEKYSSWNFPQLYKAACHKIETVLAKLGNGDPVKSASAPAVTKSAAQTPQGSQPAEPQVEWTKEAIEQAAAAGYRLAELAARWNGTPEDESIVKFAAAEEVVQATINEYYSRADLVGEYVYKTAAYEEQLLKRSADDPMGGSIDGGGGLPPEQGGMPPELGGAPSPEGLPPGAGDLPPGGEGGEGGGEGGGDADVVNEMANALIDAGIPPEKLIEALQSAAAEAGGAGGGPGGPGGAGLEGGDPAAAGLGGEKISRAKKLPFTDIKHLHKVAVDISNHMYGGKFRRTRPGNKQAAAERADAVQYLNYVREVLGVR